MIKLIFLRLMALLFGLGMIWLASLVVLTIFLGKDLPMLEMLALTFILSTIFVVGSFACVFHAVLDKTFTANSLVDVRHQIKITKLNPRKSLLALVLSVGCAILVFFLVIRLMPVYIWIHYPELGSIIPYFASLVTIVITAIITVLTKRKADRENEAKIR